MACLSGKKYKPIPHTPKNILRKEQSTFEVVEVLSLHMLYTWNGHRNQFGLMHIIALKGPINTGIDLRMQLSFEHRPWKEIDIPGHYE